MSTAAPLGTAKQQGDKKGQEQDVPPLSHISSDLPPTEENRAELQNPASRSRVVQSTEKMIQELADRSSLT